jgi:hypothetical protein
MTSLRLVLRFVLTNRNYRVYNDVAPRPATTSSRLKRLVGASARRIPHADRVLSPQVLVPSEELGLPGLNMVFIEKLGGDERHDHFHRDF